MSRRARGLLPAVAVAVLFLLPLIPEVLGTRRLIFRDAQITHWPWRRVAMAALGSGSVPFLNGSASGGQPLLANPNASLLYPTVLLELVLPPDSAFNLHYLLHVLWAFFGTLALARRIGLERGPAFVSGVAFAFSGMMLSYASAFLNSVAAAAWMPWCASAGIDLVRAGERRRLLRAVAATAIAFGLQLLAGEPALSLLTLLVTAFLALGDVFATGGGRASRRLGRLGAGGLAAGILAAMLAAALLLPLSGVLPLTYRGQHLYSEKAFGASPFALWRAIEWLFPRFNGDPGALAAGAHWQYALHSGELVYIWCVTLGVIPLLMVAIAGTRKDFWERRALWLAGGSVVSLLFALGSSLPLYRVLFALPFARRLRYPIKFYLVVTLCVALLAGLAAEKLWQRRSGLREAIALLLAVALYTAAFFLAGTGGALDRTVEPLLSGLAAPSSALLPAIRRSFRGDALFGLIATGVLTLFVFSRRARRPDVHMLGLATLILAFPWGLPLFVSADAKSLARPPALLHAVSGPGRIHISEKIPEFNVLATGSAHPSLSPSVSRLARAQIEEMIPQTAAPFGVRYLFDADPDGSYGYYNRLAAEAFASSTPSQRGRLLRAYGARWSLADESDANPLFRPITGFEIAGRRLVFSEADGWLPELRWASRAHRRSSLSGALELVRSEAFRPESEVVLPGRIDHTAVDSSLPARLATRRIEPDHAEARVEAEAAGHLLFSRTFFTAWRARVDGRPVPVLVANARELAVAVPAGAHEVAIWYDRGPFRRGVLLQALAFLAVASAARFPRNALRML